MKNLTLVYFLLCSVLCLAAPADSDYNINIHVSGTRMESAADALPDYQSLTVAIEGKKYELKSLTRPHALLKLGDYKAKLVKERNGESSYDSYRVYELLLPENKKRQFRVVGEWE